MDHFWVAVTVFVCLSLASLLTMHLQQKLPLCQRDDQTNTTVRLVANIFVVMTSLVFGLLINSSKNTFENIDNNVHAYATQIIILDNALRSFGPATGDARGKLAAYVEEAIAHPARADDSLHNASSTAASALNTFGLALTAIPPADRYHQALLVDLRQQYQRLIEQRWKIVEQSEGAIPGEIIAMLIAWMTLIFASFGYRAPRNRIVVSVFLISAFLLSLSVYLVMDMDIPFTGFIQVSDHPLRRALAVITR